ncbi:MCE family protein [Nocardioides sp. GY 10127]|uniref:MCE family protein n=1 Tax=Nocardioides sp. GY 10127 TaxID=2569762 RepID=UPI0010A79737|nr:MCE family protein [Nocardioides sp. GY 10127]TIC79948.1 MCE family protein [Nocardioides sp. GY 10127]
MKLLDARTTADLVKLGIFILVTTLATALLVVTVGNLSFAETRPVRATFTDATGVVAGDDVRVAGVKVGSVTDVDVVDGHLAMVRFDLQTQVPVTDVTHATIRYRNLVGQRYISLDQRPDGPEVDLGSEDGEPVIDVSQTAPALDLTVLFNGFKPLFQALSPADVNQLSYEIVQVFQGEGGTLESLLGHTASVTQTLADRDQVISSLIDNLNEALDHLADRDDQLSSLIVTFKRLVHGLKTDRGPILDSLTQISLLSEKTAGLVTDVREPLVGDIRQLRRLTKNIDDNAPELDRALQVLPVKLNKIGGTATYGSWFNFYLCHFEADVKLPGGSTRKLNYDTGTARCDLG